MYFQSVPKSFSFKGSSVADKQWKNIRVEKHTNSPTWSEHLDLPAPWPLTFHFIATHKLSAHPTPEQARVCFTRERRPGLTRQSLPRTKAWV